MVTLTPFSSVLDRMMSLSRAMDSSWDEDRAPLAALRTTDRSQIWFPAVDTYETESAFVIEMDVPGVHPENVEISFEQNTLGIKGVRSAPIKAPEKGEIRVFTSERLGGSFARAIRLPEYVDGERIEAAYANGVLTITVPKSAAARPRKIAIKAAGEEKKITG